MHGHRAIVAARLAGYKPSIIFIEVDLRLVPPRFDFEDAEHALATKQHARVELSLKEKWQLLDLRFVTGCRVLVQAWHWSDALHGLAKKIAANGATHIVVSCFEGGPLLQYEKGTWHAHT